MGRTAFLTLFVVLSLAFHPEQAPNPRAEATRAGHQSSAPRDFIDQHCTACHNDRARTAGLTLSGIDVNDVRPNAEVWEKVLHKLRTGQMPPAGRPEPDRAASNAMMSWLSTSLDAAAAASPNPGRVGVHRLNRTEYANAIRDLLGLEVDGKALLLPDEADEGFDNVAASLALSPAHLERYLAAARDISRLAVGDETLGRVASSAMYRVPKLLEQDVRVSEGMPFGSRGGIAVRHNFPLDGEYVFKVRLRRQIYDYIIGMGHAQQLDLRIDGKRIKRFTVGGEGKGTPGPLTRNGEIVGDTEWELYMHAADAGLEMRTAVPAGPHLISVSFVDSPWEPEGVAQPLQVDFGRGSDEQYDGYAAVDALSIHGPYQPRGSGDTPTRRTVFVCTPKDAADEAPCAKKILSTLARRAYRRNVTADEIQTLLTFFEATRKQRGFEAGIQAAVERMLVSFNFLFRIEKDPSNAKPGTVYRLSDVDLASRLSFFLWSSIPDEELLTTATRGRLKDPAVLEQQVRRMLRDPRSKALVESFGNQWLGVRKASSVLPDPNIFPEFDENLRDAFLKETVLFLENQLRDDRSILDLLNADYSFLNERLAQHYGVPNVYGERFRKVTFTDGTRGGLLGQGSILMATSYPDRTTPVLRGVWILDLLGMPPPPPPPDIPDLEPKAADGRVISIREQMELHRQNPACASCHVRMDPLGFAMENFDAIGRWRTQADGIPVDASAVFADGTPLDGVRGLRTFLLKNRDNYVHAFVGRLLTYALGRHVDYRDQPSIRKIARDAAAPRLAGGSDARSGQAGDYRWSAIVLGIVNSAPFRSSEVPKFRGS
jgi:mono/diheme cytochrome c family protein